MFFIRAAASSGVRLFPLVLATLLLGTSTGCSVMMATRAPEKKNLTVLTPGIPRSQVIAELGPPVYASQDESGLKDIFAFKQGYSRPCRVGRAGLHAVADVLTLGLWEVVGTPLEGALDGEDVRAEVRYDLQEHVRRVEYFSGAHLAHGGPTLTAWLHRPPMQQRAVVESSADKSVSAAGSSNKQSKGRDG